MSSARRFVFVSEAKCAQMKAEGFDVDPDDIDEDSHRTCLIERREDGSARFVACDGGEPEDASFGRDFNWVIGELNRLVKEIEALKAVSQ